MKCKCRHISKVRRSKNSWWRRFESTVGQSLVTTDYCLLDTFTDERPMSFSWFLSLCVGENNVKHDCLYVRGLFDSIFAPYRFSSTESPSLASVLHTRVSTKLWSSQSKTKQRQTEKERKKRRDISSEQRTSLSIRLLLSLEVTLSSISLTDRIYRHGASTRFRRTSSLARRPISETSVRLRELSWYDPSSRDWWMRKSIPLLSSSRPIAWSVRSFRWNWFGFTPYANCFAVSPRQSLLCRIFILSAECRWLQDPPRLQRELCPVTGHKKRNHSDKFRVTLDVTGYKPEDLSVKVVGRKLFIDGKQELRDGISLESAESLSGVRGCLVLGEDFSTREMRKTYELPENASFDHMTSFLTSKGLLLPNR